MKTEVTKQVLNTDCQKGSKLNKHAKLVLVNSILLEDFQKYLVKKKCEIGNPACGYSRGQHELILQILKRFKRIKMESALHTSNP